MFSWRGFLYYKWSLVEFWPSLIQVAEPGQGRSNTSGAADHEQKVYITRARETIMRGAKRCSDDIRNMLAVYDQAYESLTAQHDAKQFREFLLNAPAMFLEIGEKMGTLSHITSFWNYRFPENITTLVDAEELTAIFQDFSKSFAPERQAA